MVTEIAIWAMILANGDKHTLAVYDNELLCRQEMREVRRAAPDVEVRCVPKHSTARPEGDGRATE
jgi:hypothetical protein